MASSRPADTARALSSFGTSLIAASSLPQRLIIQKVMWQAGVRREYVNEKEV